MYILISLMVVILVYSLISRSLKSTPISGHIFFVSAGMLLSSAVLGVVDLEIQGPVFLIVSEITLALVLFTDASRIDLKSLRQNRLPERLLSIGLLLSIAAGTGIALAMFTGLGIWEAALIGVILAPTDAGLGLAIVQSLRVPVRIRQTLNVESGLNDGIVFPFLLLFIGLAEEAEGVGAASLPIYILELVGYGVMVGIGVGIIGGWLIRRASQQRYMSRSFRGLAVLALAILSWAITDEIGGSGFIAAFVAGLTVGYMITSELRDKVIEFTSEEGEFLNLSVFFMFGAIAATRLGDMDAAIWIYAILSLTVVRMIPVAISLIGTDLHWRSMSFIGWFGPRGLASIVMALIILDETEVAAQDEIALVVMATVVLSVFLHGISTNPAISWYSKHTKKMHKRSPEKQMVPEMPTRGEAIMGGPQSEGKV